MGKGPTLPNIKTMIEAGIDPKTGMPLKAITNFGEEIKSGMKKLFRIKDLQQAVNRYKWTNFPVLLSSADIERLLYYKGQLAFFYFKDIEKYFLMPFALDGGIDFYMRYNSIHPVPFATGKDLDSVDSEQRGLYTNQANLLSTLKLTVMHDTPEKTGIEVDEKNKGSVAVLLRDYRQQFSQVVIPRFILQEPLLDVISDLVPFLRTALMMATGVTAVRVEAQDTEANVIALSQKIYNCALKGLPFAAVIGPVEMQELTGASVTKVQEFLEALQALDNLRLSFYGVDNTGVFQKKAHMLEDEQDMNADTNASVLQDGLEIRQRFCEIANATFGLDISVEINEEAIGNNMYKLESAQNYDKTIEINKDAKMRDDE